MPALFLVTIPLIDDLAEPRLPVMFGILLVSLLAVSFPGISKKASLLRIPHLVFFIGKHFGTGVILSTAFCHLLPDAFESLNDPAVEKRYHMIGKWTGMIILSSLLSIFLIEYASTTYVDYLNAKDSTPEPSSSRPDPSSLPTPKVMLTPTSQPEPSSSRSRSRSPIPVSHFPTHITSPSSSPRIPTSAPRLVSEGSPLLPRGHKRTKSLCGEDEVLLPLILLNSPRLSRGGLQHAGLVWGKDLGCICPMGRMILSQDQKVFEQEEEGRMGKGKGKEVKPGAGRRRQVVGILVLQLGIMIHSLVIGLTLAVTSGADFTSLVSAIVFHQLFEGLSLGVRIASLPPTHTDSLSSSSESWKIDWLNATLSILFAITTPLGMAIGMAAFTHAHPSISPSQTAQMGLTQGVLSAISAGMLIYAATVEMLGGDFVFGDVAGELGPSHDHGHGHHDGVREVKKSGSGTGRRVLAVASLLAGVVGMGLVGLGE